MFVDTEPVWRGGQDQLLTLLRGLIVRGHRLHLICHPQTLLEERAREAGVTVHPLTIRSEAGLVSFVPLLAILTRVRPEVLAFNTPRPIFLGNLASRFAGVKARIIFRRVNFPLRKNFISRLKYNWGIDCIVTVSESIRQQLRLDGVPGSRIRTIYEGIDLTPYTKRECSNAKRPGEPTVVGTVAHFSAEKGLCYLVEAAALIPNVHTRMRFVLVGDGACRQHLENQVRDLGLEDSFHFAGFQKKPIPYLGSFDCFVLPSLSEGLSSAILSAMAASLPVIATDVGGIPELIRHEENGLLVPPADPVALAQAIQRLGDDPAEAFRMGREGRLRAEKQFALPRMILQIEQLCWSFIRRAAPASGAVHV
ncbi:MAG: glycosyltransferase [Acidobacteriia bacterium]|nr:glycosyltransferase [Terriglobia bacterium]